MSIKSVILIAFAFVCTPRGAPAQAPDSSVATARCQDGTYSYSTSRQGTCARHGGVSEWLATPAATAKCNDGTLSASVSRQGACSKHGGVAEWLIPVDATARCRDGTYSTSTSSQGTCSNHGGVAEWYTSDSDYQPAPSDEQTYIAAMKSDLRNLVTAEEVFFADSVKYTAKIGSGGLDYSVAEGNTMPRITLTADGWRATIGNVNTGVRCFIFIGTTTNPPAMKEGYPTCTTP